MSTLDRDAAREALESAQWWAEETERADTDRLLAALAGCVRPDPPQTIDRAALSDILGRQIGVDPQLIGVYADRILALLRPVEGVVPDSRFDTIRALHQPHPEEHEADGFCSECGFGWPCATIRALDGDPA